MPIEHKNGDILNATEQYIAHQANCVTKHSRGLATAIFNKFPDANIYVERETKARTDVPGTIEVRGRIINMLAQYNPGKPHKSLDTGEKRKRWFQLCLDKIAELEDIDSVAFPFQIGCNLAGGVWSEYLEILNNFSTDHPEIKISIYKLEGTYKKD